MSKSTCANCDYMLPRFMRIGSNALQKQYYCHKNAPITNSGGFRIWPEVEFIDWCGEHKPKEEADSNE